MTETEYFLLIASAIGSCNIQFKKLLERAKSAKGVFEAIKDRDTFDGIDKETLKKLSECDVGQVEQTMSVCAKLGITVVSYDMPEYPASLRSIPNPPPVLFCKGDVSLLSRTACLSMVGTRHCTKNAADFAYDAAFALASSGVTVVTGLALGIDGICSRAALDAGGKSIGVLGCGADIVYPDKNASLFADMEKDGLIISEFMPFTEPKGKNFPIRNRIISGLSHATVIVEAGEKSGALITAKLALEQGRKLYAVPGDIANPESIGTNALIKNSAYVFTSYEDILKEYSLLYPDRIFPIRNVSHKTPTEHIVAEKPKTAYPKTEKTAKTKAPPEKQKEMQKREPDISMLDDEEKKIYLSIKTDVFSPDSVIRCGFDADKVLSALTMFEMYGLVERLPGGSFGKL